MQTEVSVTSLQQTHRTLQYWKERLKSNSELWKHWNIPNLWLKHVSNWDSFSLFDSLANAGVPLLGSCHHEAIASASLPGRRRLSQLHHCNKDTPSNVYRLYVCLFFQGYIGTVHISIKLVLTSVKLHGNTWYCIVQFRLLQRHCDIMFFPSKTHHDIMHLPFLPQHVPKLKSSPGLGQDRQSKT